MAPPGRRPGADRRGVHGVGGAAAGNETRRAISQRLGDGGGGSKLADHFRADRAPPRYLTVRPSRPLRIIQQRHDSPPLVLVGPPHPVRGIGADREQDRVTARALPHVARDEVPARSRTRRIAKQADDDTLRKLADRIQARAVRRCGELLKQFDGRGRPAEENKAGAVPVYSQRQVGADAGMSERQVKTAVRVANVPAAAFERAAEPVGSRHSPLALRPLVG